MTARVAAVEAGGAGAAAFDLSGPLPDAGTTVIEASAGTGKTFTLAGLTARYLAAGVDPSAILAVTFTRMATGELRDRIRRRLAQTEAALEGALAHGTEPGDEVAALLAAGARPEVEARRQRLADAVAAFDGLTVTTTHGFCQLVLAGLGSAGDLDVGATLLEDPDDLLEEVVADLYLRRAEWDRARPPFGFAAARAAAAAAIANPDALLVPDPAEGYLLSRLAHGARKGLAERLQDANLLTYDHVLTRLAATLGDPARGAAACTRLQERYQVVLVDEFQDTDPVQWEVLRRAFGTGATTLVLIGDPKQAIYAFRGADVHAYLAAHRQARRFTLGANWRADQPLLDATDALLSPLQLGHPAIRFRSVEAPAAHRRPGLLDAPVCAPLRVRLVPDRHAELPRTPSRQLLAKGPASAWIADDVAAEAAALLASPATVPDGPGRRPIRPNDVAVLTRTNAQADSVRAALRAAAVPAVLAGGSNVFASAAARDWLRLLEALQEPASRGRAAAAARTPFLGLTAAEVAAADERRWEAVHDRLHRWAAVLAERGVAALHRTVTVGEGLPARLLAVDGGERTLTDLGHIGELLHAEALAGQLGAPALRAWLEARVDEARPGSGAAPDERARRLDSDAEAVQVLTVHRAKGLEFGVVLCPFLWDAGREGGSGPVLFHRQDEGDAGPRYLDVGNPDGDRKAAYARSVAQAREEARGEDLRTLYVAVTRARHQVVLWWARASNAHRSALGRLLTARDEDGRVGPGDRQEPDERRVRAALAPLEARAAGLLVVETAAAHRLPAAAGEPRPAATPPPPEAFAPDLATATFDRTLDRRWRRASYSSIVAAAHDEPVGSEPEDPGIGDEPADGAATAPPAPAGEPCPLADMPRGAEVGTFVHGLLEAVDFQAPDVPAALTAAAVRADPPGTLGGDPRRLGAGLALALATPLGPALPGVALRDVGRAERLDELRFELPLAGGDRPDGAVDTAELAALLAEHIPAGDPLAGYPERLADPLLAASLRGYLTGSLDLVFRRPGPAGGTWWIADYKTNWLGDDGSGPAALTTWHYRPEALAEEMQRRHYPLQALLYAVALHRYLRWRLPGYTPQRNLGGVLYLFLRGMVGPTAPEVGGVAAGVFAWSPPTRLVTDLSALLGTGRRPRVATP
ncbi:MAG TPA: UvrD-helicase domain-containing protein [Acidimicrobiales bacterium]|nr:UvrD-helicase domain-containing protein [Acidimicrobiales bacterium]